jgi:hypothetical protein
LHQWIEGSINFLLDSFEHNTFTHLDGLG